MRLEQIQKKAGVSLVTVLLFMLVATIAATATYKWLTSEGRSSASRMLQQEAYQSSVAGIENARTWMTFHANDVGALVKTYLDSSRKPINLDARLRPLQKAGQDYHVWLTGVNTEKSTYKLKIMSSGEAGGGTRHSETAIFNVDGLYQVKVPHEKVVASVPFEHNYFGGSTYSAGTIKAHSLLINGNLNGTNPVYTDADLIVTGNVNVDGSSIGAGGTVCVGGNLDAKNGVLGNDFYVVGNAVHFTFPTTSEAAKKTNANVTGNVYIGGNLDRAIPQDQMFQKNLTIMGKWNTNLKEHGASVAGNLCLGPDAQVQIDNTSRLFHVDGNVWSEPDYPVWWTGHGELNHDKYDRIILGNSGDSKVYIRTIHPSSDYVTLRNNRAFVESRSYYRGAAGGMGALTWDKRTYYPYQNVPAADDKYYLYKYTGSGQDVDYIVTTSPWGMGTISYANYYVENQVFYTPAGFGFMPGPLGPGGENHTLNMGAGDKPTGSPYCKATPDRWRPECKVTPWFKSLGTIDNSFSAVSLTPGDNFWKSADKDFECAESVKEHCDAVWHEDANGCNGAKYKVDDILVTAYDKFESYAEKGCAKNIKNWNSNLSRNLNACYETTLAENKDNLYNGYLVVKVRDGGKSDPTTPLKGKFIIIVQNAMGQQALPPTTADSYAFVYLEKGQTGDAIQPATENGIYNYFIYTKDNIKQIMFNNADFSGSVYATAASCAQVLRFQSRNMIYNDALMKDLATNGVVCPATVSSCGGVGTGSSDPVSSSSVTSTGSVDNFYISMAPQLGVRLESQYKSDEPLPSGNEKTNLSPSFIVLPRVIYLPSDPYGSLSDYYNVQPLNGSTLKKSNVSTVCSGPGTLKSTGTMFEGASLTKGIYTCTASTNVAGHSPVPFWVVVGDGTRGIPPVSFVEPSHQMDPSEEKEVQITVPVRSTELDINIYCPNPDNDGWSYVEPLPTGVTRNGTSCSVHVGAGAATTVTVFKIKTENALVGTMSFQIMPGEGYIPGMYATTQLFIASSAVLDRLDVTLAQRKAYCDANPDDCPSDTTGWLDCPDGGIWVEPSGTPYSNITANNSWTIVVGNTEEITLTKPSDFNDCVVIIPTTDNSIPANGVVANTSYTLRASAKAKTKKLKVGFVGNVGSNKNPTIQATAGTRNVKCLYNNAVATDEESEKVCTIDIFDGETVSLELLEDDSEEFNYWSCSGTSCPTTSAIVSSRNYDAFVVNDNDTKVLAHFGEKDNHCFFDEIKNSSVECDVSGETRNCIDKCGDDDIYSTCAEADAGGLFPNAKWHLMSGYIPQIVVGPDGEIHIDKSVNKGKKESNRTSVLVLSTVEAGVLGSLKALVNVPRATSSYDRSATNIKNSGFVLRSNVYGNDYFMLNLYENGNGQLEAQLWKGNTSLSLLLTNDGSPVNISGKSSMIMATMTVKTDSIYVSAIVDGFYGQNQTAYSCAFDLTDFGNTLADMAHEFVGYSLADPSFKIYGIGWRSDTYNAQCHDTYPTVKCSFAAVANDGVIKTGVPTKPWIGYSGWFDAKNCSPLYYYNGDDATISSEGYEFDNSGRGIHGYTDEEGNEQKTAKAWLGNCLNISDEDVAWGMDAERLQAHCGTFWTGKYDECTAHQDLYSGSTSASDGVDATITFTKQSLRAATLHITLENDDRNEVEIWLVSESDNWGEDGHESHSVKMTGNSASFDVVREFAAGSNGSYADGTSNGFDPENVMQIVVRNHGTTSVNVTKVTTTCANAIGITNCRADYNGTSWDVVTQVTNKNLVTSLNVVARIGGSAVINEIRNAENPITWNGDYATMQIVDDAYAHQGESYKFSATISGESSEPTSKDCSVSPDPIGTVGVTCSVIGTVASGARFPTFNVDFSGCPGAGCGYEMYLCDGSTNSCESTPFATGTEKSSARHSANQSETCTAAEGCPHYYEVRSTDNKFNVCRADFKVVRNAEDAPPSVTCGVSTSQSQFTNDLIFVTDNAYFLARNVESVERQYSGLVLKEGENEIGTMSLNNWSQLTNKSLGNSLTAGNHTYSLYYNGEKVCETTVTVNAASGACSLTGDMIESQNLTMNVSGVRSNTQFRWIIGDEADPAASTTIDCDATHCWNNTLGAPAGGTYSYVVKKGSTTICSGEGLTITPALTCSVDPTELDRKAYYTFTATRNVNCYECSFIYGSTTQNIPFPNNSNTVEISKKALTAGEQILTYRCKCGEANRRISCSDTITVNNTDAPFSCPVDNNPYEWSCEEANGSGSHAWGTTGARCVKLHASLAFVQASNYVGREFCVNGTAAEITSTAARYSAASDGYITVCASPGDNTSIQLEWYGCGQPNTGDGPCIVWVQGTGDYDEHCYSSGLKNMEEGKCYKLNPDRPNDEGGVPTNINDDASAAWWWVETPCDGSDPASSSSAESSTSYCSVEPTFIHSDCSENTYGTNGFDTKGPVCIKINGNVGGFGCSECDGRSWRINGGSSTTGTGAITATDDGYSYIDVSGGSKSWTSMAFYNISCP